MSRTRRGNLPVSNSILTITRIMYCRGQSGSPWGNQYINSTLQQLSHANEPVEFNFSGGRLSDFGETWNRSLSKPQRATTIHYADTNSASIQNGTNKPIQLLPPNVLQGPGIRLLLGFRKTPRQEHHSSSERCCGQWPRQPLQGDKW